MWSRGSVFGAILAVFAIFTSVAWWTGCSDPDSEQPGGESRDRPTVTTIGAEGGVITAGGVTLRIPAGALEADVTITITPIGELTLPGYRSRTQAYRFEPSGLQFSAPVEIDLAVEGERAKVSVLWSGDGQAFDALPTEVIPEGIRSHIQHFSLGLGAELLDFDVDGGADGGDAGASREVVIFVGNDGAHGSELWSTDGTPEGTSMLKDIEPGAQSSRLTAFTVLEGAVYFAASRPGMGWDLWKTNGTAEGTVMLTQVTARPDSYPKVVPFNGRLYFWKDETGRYDCLWKTDGTVAGTVRVSNRIRTQLYSTAVAKGALFFVGMTGTNDNELWKTDGTDEGTVRVKDIRPGASGSNVGGLTAFDDTIYFSAADGSSGTELWKSDGTENGTVMVKDLAPGGDSGLVTATFGELGGRLYFGARSGTRQLVLWSTDGTATGTQPVKLMAQRSTQYPIGSFSVFNGALYFTADDGVTGPELWKSDGTAGGTTLFKDLVPGAEGGLPGRFTLLNGAAYFSAYSRARLPSESAPPMGLWTSDGTPAGTVLTKANASALVRAQQNLYFATDDGIHGRELWKMDGTPAGTVMVTDLFPGAGSGFAGGEIAVLPIPR